MDGADKYDYEGEDPQVVLQEVTKKLMDCRRRKAAANAVDLLVSLGRAGIQPDLLASTTCLGACVASGKMDLALKVFEEVFDKGEEEGAPVPRASRSCSIRHSFAKKVYFTFHASRALSLDSEARLFRRE